MSIGDPNLRQWTILGLFISWRKNLWLSSMESLAVPLWKSHPNPKWGKLSKKSQSSKFFQGKISHPPVRVVTNHTTTGLPSFHDSHSLVGRHHHFVNVSLAQFQPSLAQKRACVISLAVFDDKRKSYCRCFLRSRQKVFGDARLFPREFHWTFFCASIAVERKRQASPTSISVSVVLFF